MPLETVLLLNLAAIALMCVSVWIVSLVRRDASIVDIFWGIGFVLVAWLSFTTSPSNGAKAVVLAVIVTIWGGRLAGYLAWRNHGKGEDYRYVAMRDRHGSRFPLVSLVTVFGLQGLLMWIISLPVQVGIARAGPWNAVSTAGLVLWAIGWLFEAIGDYQLARFKSRVSNHGRVMREGLWRYTRHPNYFGDFLVWWGFYFVGMNADSWWTIVGPLVMSFLLIRVSGVRLLETSLRDRVDGYDEYIRDTSSFFPFPPKRNAGD